VSEAKQKDNEEAKQIAEVLLDSSKTMNAEATVLRGKVPGEVVDSTGIHSPDTFLQDLPEITPLDRAGLAQTFLRISNEADNLADDLKSAMGRHNI